MTTRQAHIDAALGLRRTAHHNLREAVTFPRTADKSIAEARRLLKTGLWFLSMARNIDAYEEWRKTR